MERSANKDEICLPLIAARDQDDDHQEQSCQKKTKNTKDNDDSQKKKQQRVLLVAAAVVGYPLFILVVLTGLGLVSVLLYQPSWPLFFFTSPKTTTAAVTEAADTTNNATTWWSSSGCWSMVGFFASSMLYRYTLWRLYRYTLWHAAAASNQPDGASAWIGILDVIPELGTLCIFGLCSAGQAEVAAVVFQVGEFVMLAAIEVYWVGQLSWSWCQSWRQCRKTTAIDSDEAALSTTATDCHAFDKNCSGHAV
jgi:hypothetical protein